MSTNPARNGGPRPRRRHRTKPTTRSVADIRVWLPAVFAALVALEAVLAFSTFRYWGILQDALADQKTLFLANEILARARQDSATLGRLSFQATTSADSRSLAEYRDHLLEKLPAPMENTPADIRLRNPIPRVEELIAKLRSPSASLGDSEGHRIARLSRESESLLRLDEKTLAALEGRFEDDEGNFTVTKAPAPETARGFLRDQSYQARRATLNEDLAATQAAFDVRILSLLGEISRNGTVFFPLALATTTLLLVCTPFLGVFLQRHIGKTITTHKLQIRKINDEISRLQGELSKAEFERDDLARRLQSDSTASTPARISPPKPTQASPSPNDLPPGNHAFPHGFADEYLTRMP